jgi:hypothetical protein
MKYAKIENEIIVNVIVCSDTEISNFPGFFVKVTENTKEPIIGGSYDIANNKFLNIKPFSSWVLDENFDWISPKGVNPNPATNTWDEENQEWVPAVPSQE